MTTTASTRVPKGEVVRNPTRGGFTFALRFTAYNKRRYLTLGRPEDGWTEARARTELENILADVRRGIWQPHTIEAPPEPPQDPGFHEFASAWFEAIRGELRADLFECALRNSIAESPGLRLPPRSGLVAFALTKLDVRDEKNPLAAAEQWIREEMRRPIAGQVYEQVDRNAHYVEFDQ